MKQTIKIFAVLCMTLVVVLLMASCDDLLKNSPPDNQTTPAETTPAATTPEETTPEETTPEAHEHVWEEWTTLKEATCGVEGMKQRSCTTCPEVEYFSVVPTQNHLYNNECDTDCNACGATREVFNHQYGGDCDATCNVIGCGFVREAGEHQYDNDCDATCNVCSKARVADHDFVDGACTECGVALGVFENTSVYDNDGDGKNDVYLFTPIIPEKFTGEDVIHVWGGDYIPELSSSYVSASFFGDIRHWYCTQGMGEYFTYKVTVDEAGIYEMAIHTRLKDTRGRGAKFTVNAGAENEYSFEISFQFATDEEVSAAMENNYTRTSYMYGIQIELQAGDNYIKIEEASMVDWSLQWRDFYFVKVADLCTEHTWGEWVTVKEPNCEEDGLKKHICIQCNASEEAPIDDLVGVHAWGNRQVVQKPVSCVEPGIERYTCSKCNATKDTPITDTKLHIWGEPILENEITCTQSSDGIKLCTKCGESIKVHVFAQGHKWGEWNILSDVPCGQTGSQRSHTCQVCGKTETLSDGRTHHVWGNPVEVTAPTCTQSGKAIKTCTICGSESAEEIFRKDHVYENGICTSCGHVEGSVETPPVFEKTSGYDSDGDGANDVYFFTPVLPERFEGEDAIHLWMDEYEADLSSNFVPETKFSGNYNHVYFDEGQGQYAVYKITVSQAGIYEMAIHTRLKDTKERGGKYTVNAGTEHEYSFETSFQFTTDEEVYAARENAYTMSSYMYGMYLELQEGDNYIKIELSSGGEKSMHWREFFFVKVEE